MNLWSLEELQIISFFRTPSKSITPYSEKYNCSPIQIKVNGNELFGFEWGIDSK